MKRSEAIELLEKYNQVLMENGFADSDLWCEPPTAIDTFMGTEWAKINLPIGNLLHEDGTPLNNNEKDSLKIANAWIKENVIDGQNLFDVIEKRYGRRMTMVEFCKTINP